MVSATHARSLKFVDGAASVLAAALVARRGLEFFEVNLSSRWSRRRTTELGLQPSLPAPGPSITCVVPMYEEADIAADTVRAWSEVAQHASVGQVIFVTTAKEESGAGLSTREVIVDALRELRLDTDSLCLLHCEDVTPFRASQLNLAVEHVRRREALAHTSDDEVWIGVYNADSRPQLSTFGELAQRTRIEPATRVFQQLADYVVPQRPGTGLLAVGNSVLQTWWTRSHYWARNRRAGRGTSWWSAISPYSTFGHGEFIRIDFLDDIGGFPDFAYADGLLLGWICRLRAEPIGLLASRDRAEVPRTTRDLLTQQTAWIRGLLNFGATTRWCRERGQLHLPPSQVTLLRAAHLVIPVSWGLSSLAVAAASMGALRRLAARRASRADLVRLGALMSYALLPALLPDGDDPPAHSRRRRVAGAALAWPIEGLAFWPALSAYVRGSSRPPLKTPR